MKEINTIERPDKDKFFRPFVVCELFAKNSSVSRKYTSEKLVIAPPNPPGKEKIAFDWIIADNWDASIAFDSNIPSVSSIVFHLFDMKPELFTEDVLIGKGKIETGDKDIFS